MNEETSTAGQAGDEPPDEGLLHTLAAEFGMVEGADDVPDEAQEGLPARGVLGRVLHWIGVAELVLGSALILFIMVLVLIQVSQRYMPGPNWVWTGEIARFSLVWSTLALSGYLTAHDEHITLEVIDYVASPRQLGWIKRFSHVVMGLTAIAMTFESYQLISERSGQVSPATRMPLTYVYILPFVGFILTAMRSVVAVFLADLTAPTAADDPVSPEEVDYP